MNAPRTGLVVPVPDLETRLERHRLAWDPVAALGARAHVTVLFPFAYADDVDDALLARVGDALRGFVRFPITFDQFGSFEADVLYLSPEPEQPFRDITEALAAAFPEYPPYGGGFAEVVPHLTVANDPAAPVGEIQSQLAALLPVSTTARAVELWVEGTDGQWSSRATFELDDP